MLNPKARTTEAGVSAARISLVLKTNTPVTFHREALTMQGEWLQSAEQKHSQQTVSECEHSDWLQHGTPNPQRRGARVPAARQPGGPGAQSSQISAPAGWVSGARARGTRLALRPDPSLRSVLPRDFYIAYMGYCPAGVGEREGPQVRRTHPLLQGQP